MESLAWSRWLLYVGAGLGALGALASGASGYLGVKAANLEKSASDLRDIESAKRIAETERTTAEAQRDAAKAQERAASAEERAEHLRLQVAQLDQTLAETRHSVAQRSLTNSQVMSIQADLADVHLDITLDYRDTDHEAEVYSFSILTALKGQHLMLRHDAPYGRFSSTSSLMLWLPTTLSDDEAAKDPLVIALSNAHVGFVRQPKIDEFASAKVAGYIIQIPQRGAPREHLDGR